MQDDENPTRNGVINMAMEYFCAYHSYLESIKDLTDEECGRLFRSCLEYSRTGQVPDPMGNEKFAFAFIKRDIDTARGNYERKCENNRANIQKRWHPDNSKTDNTTVYDGKNGNTNLYDVLQNDTNHTKEKEKEKEKAKEKERESRERESAPTPSKPKPDAVQLAENVTMTNAEHNKLLATYGPADTARLIEMLDNYKGASGKKYKSDYRAILNWCVQRLQDEKAKRPRQQSSGNVFADMVREGMLDE